MKGKLYRVFRRLSYLLVYGLIYIVAKVLYRTRVRGRENVPESGEMLVVSRHYSYLDPPFLGIALGGSHQVHFIARQGLLKNLFLALPVRLFSTTINRDDFGKGDLRKMLRTLRREKVVCILPEGTTKSASAPKHGAVKMAERTGKVLLPVKISSDHYPPTFSHPFPRIDVCIGEPFRVEDLIQGESSGGAVSERRDKPYQLLTEGVMRRIDEVPCCVD